jgi:hypothetical protein
MGGTSLISRFLGAREHEKAERTLGNGITCTIILSLVITAAVLPNVNGFLRLIGASDAVLPYARPYLLIVVAGTLFNLTGMALLNYIRAEGNARVPMIGNIAGAYSPWMPPKPGPLTSGGITDGLKNTTGLFKGLLSKFTGPVAAAGLGTTALAVAGVGAAGYGAGRLAGENIAWSGKSLDEHVQDLFARMFLSKKEQEAYFAPTINVNVDKDGRSVVEYEGQGKSKARINVKREKF